MMNSISVVIPTIRTDSFAPLISVIESVKKYLGEKELILVADRPIQKDDPLANLRDRFDFIKLIENKGRRGSASARLQGIKQAKYHLLLFTDDDCFVEPEWVSRMSTNGDLLGNCTGNILAVNQQNLISRMEAYIDYYRIRAKNTHGSVKFASFPNFVINRSMLPEVPFQTDQNSTVEDVDLSCRLNLRGKFIHLDETISVRTNYPTTFKDVIARKIKHARGLSYLKKALGGKAWNDLEIGSDKRILLRWIKISLTAPFRLNERLLFLIINLSYCLAIYYFTIKIKFYE